MQKYIKKQYKKPSKRKSYTFSPLLSWKTEQKNLRYADGYACLYNAIVFLYFCRTLSALILAMIQP